MGWSGHGLYDGDGTQTMHYSYLEWVGINEEIVMEGGWLQYKGTKIPKEYIPQFVKGIPKILKKMKKTPKYWDEDSAINWQMLACLFLDIDIKMPKIVHDNAINATIYLMGDHASDFIYPQNRRRVLNNLINRIKKAGYSK